MAESANNATVMPGGTITDSTGALWGLAPTGTRGVQAVCNGVIDRATSNLKSMLYYNRLVYVADTSGRWSSKSKPSDVWKLSPGGDPRVSHAPATPAQPPESPSNTGLISEAGQLVDASGTVWTLRATAKSGFVILINGKISPYTANVVLLLYYGATGKARAIYQKNAAGGWWIYQNGAWIDSSDPRPQVLVESASDTALTSTSGQIVDSHLAIWTLRNVSGRGLAIFMNGKDLGNSANVIVLLYHLGVVFQENQAGGWWLWTGSAWLGSSDPRAPASPVPVPVQPPAPIPTPIPAPTPTPVPAPLPSPVTAGPGPGASSLMATADFTALTGQHAAPALWGIAAAAPQNHDFALCADPDFLDMVEQISPALFRLNSNTGVGSTGSDYWSDAIFANGIDNPNWGVIQRFMANAHRFVKPGCRLIIGVRLTGRSFSDYGRMCGAMANHFRTTPGGDGNLIPVWGWEVGNEEDGHVSDTDYCSYFNAAADAYHAIDPSYKVIGPVDSYANGGRTRTLAQQCGAKIGALCYHSYFYGKGGSLIATDANIFTGNRSANDMSIMRSAVQGTAAQDAEILMGEWNIDFAAQGEPRQQTIVGACFAAHWVLQAFHTNLGLGSAALWETYGDGTYGVIQPGRVIDPTGRFFGKAGQVMGGAEVAASVSGNGTCECLAIVNGSKFAFLALNYSTTGADLTGRVALSHWPVNGSGNGTVNRWEISKVNPNGAESQLNVTNGLTDPTVIPAMSIVIFHN